MGISTEQYRAVIGLFGRVVWSKSSYTDLCLLTLNICLLLSTGFLTWLLLVCGDIHPNPGPVNIRTRNCIKVSHTNIRSLTQDKLDDIVHNVSELGEIITISETFLKPESDLVGGIPGYQPIFRLDRVGRIGGGVAAYISNSIAAIRRNDLEQPNLEAMWLELRNGNKKFLLCVCYRPPDALVGFWEDLQSAFDAAKLIGIDHMCLIGDLNADPRTHAGTWLQQFSASNNLTSLVHEPTRITETSATIIDQCLSNTSSSVSHVAVLPPVSTNDHCSIVATLLWGTPLGNTATYQRWVWDYSRGDFDGFRNSLSNETWESCTGTEDIDTVARTWTETFLNIARRYIPNKVITVRERDQPWYSAYLRKLKRKKDRLHNRAKSTNSPIDWLQFRNSRNFYISECREAKQNYDLKLAASLRENRSSKNWWHVAKTFLRKHQSSQYPPMNNGDNELVTENKDKANIFNKHFLTFSNIDSEGSQLPADTSYTDVTKEAIVTNDDEVLSILKSLKTNKASGPDGISPKLLKEAAPSICSSLTKLFNLSFRLGKVPVLWKQANVVPIFKKGDKTLVTNYRPISLLSVVGKVLERVTFKHVHNHLQENKLISKFQSGFTPGDSTVYQLAELYHLFTQAIDQKKSIRVVFCDISKAFDKVWHAGLLFKLKAMGIKGTLLTWFQDYLSGRQQRVVISGSKSEWGNITAGVPQGSVLGPLLFLIYINDIVTVVNSNIRLFADDTSLFVCSDDDQEASDRLNVDLEQLRLWAEQWLINFSPPKTVAMNISFKQRNQQVPLPDIKFNEVTLTDVEEHKHLGITFSHNLSWTTHITEISQSAGRILNIMAYLRDMIDRKTLESMFFSFVRPKLEYADIVWADCTQRDAELLESVQKRAARIVSGGIRGTSTETLYNELGWRSLSDRRDIHSLSLFYQIINGASPEYLTEHIPQHVGDRVPTYGLRNRSNITPFFTRTERFRNSFFPRAVRLWNSLDLSIRNSPSYKSFKAKLMPTNPNSCAELYYWGDRQLNIQHARLRMGCSILNEHLFKNHVLQSAACDCGALSESACHYFFECLHHTRPRAVLLDTIIQYCQPTLKFLLFGNPDLTLDENKNIFSAVHTFIDQTGRFKT